MEEYMADNAAVEETAPAEETTAEDGAAAVEPKEDVSTTKAFSDRLNAMSQKRVDEFVVGLGLRNDITGEDIRTQAQYDRWRRMQSAQESGRDPVASEEVSNLKGELAKYRVTEQDTAMQSDPDVADAYAMVRDEVLDLVQYCHANGNTDVGVREAFQAVMSKNAGKVFKGIKEKASATALKKASDAAKASPGKLSGGDIPGGVDYASMSDADFAIQLKLAKAGKLRAK